jgi:hypothetical protein
MRLTILDRGHTLRMKAVLKLIGVMSRAPAPDVLKTLMYRPEFFGRPIGAIFQEAMRGPSEWSVAEREMMASYVSKVNECEF